MSANNTSSLPRAVAQCCSARTLLAAAATLFAFRFLLAVVLLCVCFVLLRQLWRRNARPAQEHPQPQQQTKHGLDAATIALLPAFLYRRAVADDAGATSAPAECAVCLSDLDEGQTVRRLPGCKHVFHRECIDIWLASRASCPVCRGNAAPARAIETTSAAASTAACIVPIDMSDDETVHSSSMPGETERAMTTQWDAGNDAMA